MAQERSKLPAVTQAGSCSPIGGIPFNVNAMQLNIPTLECCRIYAASVKSGRVVSWVLTTKG